MCRLLLVNSKEEFEIMPYLKIFADIAKHSKEYQGDGWGMGYIVNGKMKYHHGIKAIWEDDLNGFGKSNLITVHARSAFNDSLKPIENNMPFFDSERTFIFNGELRGVKINAEGRIGAEKIFNFIKRFDKNGLSLAIEKSNGIIKKRAEYIRAMNYIITDKENVYINSYFNEDKEYFTLFKKEDEKTLAVCSERFPNDTGWESVENKSLLIRKRR